MGERVARDPQFAQSLLVLATALSFELDDPTIRVYWHALKSVPSEVRRQALARASEMPWFKFPQPGELKKLATVVWNEQRSAAAQRHLADCSHSGHWIDLGRGMTRCPCWTRAMQAMQAVGEPVALPASHEAES